MVACLTGQSGCLWRSFGIHFCRHNMVDIAVLNSSVQVVDSHTAGEPTRVVVGGGPELGEDALGARLRRFAAEHDDFRSAVVNEPRGSDVLVGALLCEPVDRSCAAGVIFFNNVGYLGMWWLRGQALRVRPTRWSASAAGCGPWSWKAAELAAGPRAVKAGR